MALGSLIGRGFVRIDADTSPAQKALKGLTALGSLTAVGAIGASIGPVLSAATAGTLALASSFAVAGGAATAFGAAVVPQFKDITKAMQGQTVAEDAKTKAAVNASIAQDLAKQSGFKYGQQVEITADMTESAKQKAQEYNSALSASKSASKSATQAQALYKQELNAMPKATRDTANALQALKDDTNEWSRALSSSTMPIFTQGINFLRGLLPKLTPIVKATAAEIKDFTSSLGEGTAGRVFREFGANITKNGAGALRTLLDTTKNVIVGVIGILNAFQPAGMRVTKTISEMTAKFAEFGANLGKSKGFQEFMQNIRESGPGLLKTFNDIVKIIVTVVQAMGPLAGISLKVAQAFAALLAALPTPVLKLLAQAIVITNVALKLYAIYTAAAAAATWLHTHANIAGTASLVGLHLQLILLNIQQKLHAIWSGIVTAATVAWTAATWALNAAMAVLTSPIGLVVLAIVALAAGFVIAWKKSETFRNIVKAALGGVVDAGKAVGAWFSGPFVRFFTETIPNAFNFVITWLKEHWKLIPIIFGPIGAAVSLILIHWDKVIDFFKKLPGRIVGFLAGLPQLLITKGKELILGLLSGAADVARTIGSWLKRNVLDRFVNFIKSLFGISSPSTVMARLGMDIIRGLLSGALRIAQTIGGWLSRNVFTPMTRFFVRAATWLLSAGRNIISGLLSGAKDRWNAVAEWLGGRASAVRHWIGNAAGYLTGKGKDIISGLLGGLKEKWSDAVDWIKGLKDKVVGAIKSAFGISSPASTMIPLGINIMAGLMKGILSSKGVLKSAVKKIFHSVTDVFKRGGKLLGSLVGSIGSAIGLGDNTARGSAQQYAQLAMRRYGWMSNQWPALKALWQGESGWNPLAHNASSGAHGIPQALPASKMRSAGADYWTNPVTQINWGLGYIKSRYGSPNAAYSFWLRHSPHWYDEGGIARGLGLIPKLTNKPERVLSPRQTEIFESMMSGAVRGAGTGSAIVVERLVLENKGIIGSRHEVESWLVSAFENLQRQGRIKVVTR